MPSEAERLDVVCKTLSRLWSGYQEAATVAADAVEALLRSARAATAADQAPAFAATLGALGAAYIDVGRLTPLLGEAPSLSGPLLDTVAAAGAVLREIAGKPGPVSITLPSGGNLADAVGEALARVGRVYGAAHVVALTRAERFDRSAHAPWLEAYPFSRWTRRERQLAPPIIVTLDGADFRTGGLEEFLDGALKLVLLVQDETAPPAPLVRLITPGVYVAQTHDGAQLTQLAALSGPGILAWVPTSAASFVHDPAAGPTLGARLQVLADSPVPRRGLGGLSAAQLSEELRQLEAIAGLATLGNAADALGAKESHNPVDRLATWILNQASLAEVAGGTGP